MAFMPILRSLGRRAAGRRPAAVGVLAGLLAILAGAAFARGATRLPAEGWVQLGLAALATVVCAGWLWGGRLRLAAPPAAWAGLAALAAFAAWTGISLLWSVAPERTWLELNRTVGYVLAAGIGVALGASWRHAPAAFAAGWVAVASAVALYALGGKVAPGLRIEGLIDLDHAGTLSRLRAPLGYWNALALVCVLALPLALAFAADARRGRRARAAGLLAAWLALVVLGLSYSRGGLLALAAALAVLLAVAPRRGPLLAAFALAVAAALPPLVVAFTRHDLTTDNLELAARVDDGALLGAVCVVMALGVVVGLRGLEALDRRARPSRRRALLGRRAVLIGSAAVLAVGIAGAASNGDVTATVRQEVRGFTELRHDPKTDPARLLSTSSGNRWQWWREAAGAWADRPVRGWGAGSFAVLHRAYRRNSLDVQQPHSVPLQFAAETGAVGLALGMGGLALLLWAGLGAARRARAGPERALLGALLAGAVAWFVHSWVDWDWDIPAVTLPVFAALGILAGAAARDNRTAAPGAPHPLALAAGVLSVAVVALSAALPALAEARASAALAALDGRASSRDLERALARAQVAARLNPLAAEPLWAVASVRERRGDLAGARRALIDAIERQPHDVSSWYRIARLDFRRRDVPGVRVATERALRLDPHNPLVILLAIRAQIVSVLPEASATATGTPLPLVIEAPAEAPADAAVDPGDGPPGEAPPSDGASPAPEIPPAAEAPSSTPAG